MVYPYEGDIIACAYCGKEEKATQEMVEWYCLSQVKGGEEHSEVYICSLECLKTYVQEIEQSNLVPVTREQLMESLEEREWELEEVFVRNNVLDKIQNHNNTSTCPLCDRVFLEHDPSILFMNIPIHSKCIERLS